MQKAGRTIRNRGIALSSAVLGGVFLAGCASFTYPAPQPVAGEGVSALSTASISCPAAIRGTHIHTAFSVGEQVDFCFTSPLRGQYQNAGLTFGLSCAHGLPGSGRGDTGKMIFEVYVRTHSTPIEFEHVAGRLEGAGRAVQVEGRAERREYLDLPAPSLIDGQFRYPVDGAWLTLPQASRFYTRPAYLITLTFEQECDPDQKYRLSLSGISQAGAPLAVPSVEFAPFSEAIPNFD